MMLHMIYAALKDLEDSLQKKLISWNKYESVVSSFPEAKDRQVRKMYSYLIQAALFSEKGISTDELKACFKASYYTIKKLLGCIDPEMLVGEQKGKSKFYQIDLVVLDKILLNNGRKLNKGE